MGRRFCRSHSSTLLGCLAKTCARSSSQPSTSGALVDPPHPPSHIAQAAGTRGQAAPHQGHHVDAAQLVAAVCRAPAPHPTPRQPGSTTLRTTRRCGGACPVRRVSGVVGVTAAVAHHVYGVAQAINSANYMYFKCLQRIVELGEPRAIAVYTGATPTPHHTCHDITPVMTSHLS